MELENKSASGPKTNEEVYNDIVKLLKHEFDLTDKGVFPIGKYAVASGGFADVWEGTFREKHVAIKVARARTPKPDSLALKVRFLWLISIACVLTLQ